MMIMESYDSKNDTNSTGDDSTLLLEGIQTQSLMKKILIPSFGTHPSSQLNGICIRPRWNEAAARTSRKIYDC